MTSDQPKLRFPRSSPYWPVITHPTLRRVWPGLAISAVGDGMAAVTVSWLALQLAPPGNRGVWVAIAAAAFTLPSAAGTFLFSGLARGRSGAQLAGWDAMLRTVALLAIPTAYVLGVLNIYVYVVLLAVSSLLHSWGLAGRFTLIAELLPRQHHLPANAVLTTIAEFATIIGPPLAGILISVTAAVWVIGIDALTFAILALTYRWAIPALSGGAVADREPSRSAGFRAIRESRSLLGLLLLTLGFFFLFGPVYVAMPLYVADELHRSATVLGLYYSAFGVGAVIGGLATGYLRRLRLVPVTICIVVCFGMAMLPLGLGAPMGWSLVSFAAAGLIWAPYMSASIALFQRSASTADLPQILAANSAVVVLAVPLGTILGGPLVTAIGAQQTLLLSAVGTIVLGVLSAGLVLSRVAKQGQRTPETIDD